MVKKILSSLLILVLALSLCIPVTAADKVRSVRMSKNTLEMEVGGDPRTLYVKFTPSSSSDAVTWRSSNEEIVTVDANGTVTAVKEGSTMITAKTDGGLKTTCRVTVKKAGAETMVKKIEMAVSSTTVRMNQTRILWVLFDPTNATDQDVTWTSSNTEVATVDAEGMVTGVAPGTATITAEAYNGRTASCLVTVPGTVVKGLTDDTANTQLPNNGELLTSAAVKTLVENTARTTTKGQTAIATFENKSSISAAAIRAADYTAKINNRDVQLKFITKANDKTQGWLVLDPTKFGDSEKDVKLTVSTISDKVQAVQSTFEKYFTNKVAVIYCAQSGSFGMEVQLAAKVNLAGMDKNNLRFYSYDSAANRCTLLDIASYTVSSSGYLQFSTSTGGIIVVTDSKLTNK